MYSAEAVKESMPGSPRWVAVAVMNTKKREIVSEIRVLL